MAQESRLKQSDYKYKIGKVKQTPPVLKDSKSGLEFIELKPRDNEPVYGVTTFSGNYKEEKKLGQGTFGEVYKGVHLATQRQVAMKRIIIKAENDLFPITAQREIMILKRLNHKNVLRLIEMVYDHPPAQSSSSNSQESSQGSGTSDNQKHFYMILPYMVADLSGILHNPRITLDIGDIKNMMLQIFEGINYIHCKKFMHRDIKTANILLDHMGVLKIADFGLARNYYGSPPNLKYPGGAGTDAKYTSVVVTRWYRAPELVLGDKSYTTAVDIWGIGCVFAEFFEKKPILQGKTDIDQGHVIFQLMGTPKEEEWLLARYLPGAELTRTNYEPTYRKRFGKYLSETGLDLLSKLLALDPYQRVTAMTAVKHPFFKEDPLPKTHLNLPCEESHETDIARYKQEMHQEMTNVPPAAPPGHVAETAQSQPHHPSLPHAPSQTQIQSQMPVQAPSITQPQQAGLQAPQVRHSIAPNSLPPKPKPIPSGPRYNRESATTEMPNKAPAHRQYGNQHQYNNHSYNHNNSYGNYYNRWAESGSDRDWDHSYYDAYNNSYTRKGERYGEEAHYAGYGYRPRGYHRSNDWRSNESRYQRSHQASAPPYHNRALPRRDITKPMDRPPQPYVSDRNTSSEQQLPVGNTAGSSQTVHPSSSSSSAKTNSSTKRSRDQLEPAAFDQQSLHPSLSNLDPAAYNRDDPHKLTSSHHYPRPGPPNKNDDGVTKDSNDPAKRNIIDYY